MAYTVVARRLPPIPEAPRGGYDNDMLASIQQELDLHKTALTALFQLKEYQTKEARWNRLKRLSDINKELSSIAPHSEAKAICQDSLKKIHKVLNIHLLYSNLRDKVPENPPNVKELERSNQLFEKTFLQHIHRNNQVLEKLKKATSLPKQDVQQIHTFYKTAQHAFHEYRTCIASFISRHHATWNDYTSQIENIVTNCERIDELERIHATALKICQPPSDNGDDWQVQVAHFLQSN